MSGVLDLINTMGPGVLPVLAGLGGAVSGARFVQEGQRGAKLRFGKVVRRRDGRMRIHNPGFAFVIPGVEHLIRTHVRTRTINLPSQQVVLTDRMVFQVGGVLQVRVIDSPEAIYAALFETDYLEGTVSDFATGKMREVLADLTYPEVLARTQVAESTHGLIVGQLAEWGLELIAVNLTDCAPTAQTARTILLGAEAAMRAQALADLAPAVSANLSIRTMSATLAAALIGTPVAAALGGPERRVTNQDNPVQDQDDDE